MKSRDNPSNTSHEASPVSLPYFRLFQALLGVNRKLEFISVRLQPPLTISESHLLAAIHQAGESAFIDLAKLLRVERSTITRAISNLEERGIVTIEPSRRDKRSKLARLTEDGIKLREQDAATRNAQVAELVSTLSTREISTLVFYLNKISQTLEEAELLSNPSDHPLKMPIRRVTRALGFLGENVLHTGQSLETAHILYLLKERIPLQTVRHFLPFEFSHLSRKISSLEKQGVISRVHSDQDRRRYFLVPTERGGALRSKMIEDATQFLKQATKDFSEEEREEFTELVEKSFKDSPYGAIVLPADCSLEEAVSEGDRLLARGFLIETLVHEGLQFQVSEHLISRHNRTLILRKGQQLRGVLECRPSGEITNFALSRLDDQAILLHKLVVEGLRYLQGNADHTGPSYFSKNPLLRKYFEENGLIEHSAKEIRFTSKFLHSLELKLLGQFAK